MKRPKWTLLRMLGAPTSSPFSNCNASLLHRWNNFSGVKLTQHWAGGAHFGDDLAHVWGVLMNRPLRSQSPWGWSTWLSSPVSSASLVIWDFLVWIAITFNCEPPPPPAMGTLWSERRSWACYGYKQRHAGDPWVRRWTTGVGQDKLAPLVGEQKLGVEMCVNVLPCVLHLSGTVGKPWELCERRRKLDRARTNWQWMPAIQRCCRW